VKKIKK